MARTVLILFALLLALTFIAAAQESTPEPSIIGPVTAPTAGPSPTPAPTPVDPRPAVCSAPFQPGFAPYLVRPGDRLEDLLIGVDAFSLTQIAALNCLDDPGALPVGAALWLPQFEPFIEAEPADSDSSADEAEIISLEASADQIQNQAGVFFTWEAEGTAAYFYVCNPSPRADCPRPANAKPVPLKYTTPEIGGFQYAGPLRWRLEVVDGEETVRQDVTVDITCSQDWLGQASGERQPCPPDPAFYLFAAWQPFEGGLMIWFSDTEQIWVMTRANHRVQVFPDPYTEGDPDPIATAPNGLYTPIRGFGQLWQELGGADSPLGWATAPEAGFSAARQPAGRVSYTTYILGGDESVYAVTILPGESEGWWVELE